MNANNEKKRTIFLVLAIFCSVGTLVGITEKNIQMLLLYLAFAVLFFYLWNAKKKVATSEPQPNNQTQTSLSTTVPSDDNNNDSNGLSTPNPQQEPPVMTVVSASDYIVKNFYVAGTSYQQAEIESLASENFDYSLSKREIGEQYSDGDRIYKYEFLVTNVNLVPEPTNAHDSNAIKVIADNVHIGYIKAGKCAEVRNLLNSERNLSFAIEIYGGPYKTLYVDYNYETGKDEYTIEKETSDFGAKVSITYKK